MCQLKAILLLSPQHIMLTGEILAQKPHMDLLSDVGQQSTTQTFHLTLEHELGGWVIVLPGTTLKMS